MNRYREQKDKLEYEAMVRNPETAYLVSNEEFDKQLEELGWSPSDMVTMAGMYIDRGMYQDEGPRLLPRDTRTAVPSRRPRDRHPPHLLSRGAGDSRSDSLRPVGLGRIPKHAHAVDIRYIQVYLWLPVSDMFGTILAKIQVLMLQSDIERMQDPPTSRGFERRGVYRIPDNRHHRLLHHSDRGGLDHPSRGHGRLRAQREPDGGTRRKHGGQRGGCSRRQHASDVPGNC